MLNSPLTASVHLLRFSGGSLLEFVSMASLSDHRNGGDQNETSLDSTSRPLCGSSDTSPRLDPKRKPCQTGKKRKTATVTTRFSSYKLDESGGEYSCAQ